MEGAADFVQVTEVEQATLRDHVDDQRDEVQLAGAQLLARDEALKRQSSTRKTASRTNCMAVECRSKRADGPWGGASALCVVPAWS